mmetsp:Transcript_150365/g.464001  ORF Transcript_150365/g.464001 Transcript_150365/m.464001 type:complete len:216 (-) Transcript_150365:1054-1701(-)
MSRCCSISSAGIWPSPTTLTPLRAKWSFTKVLTVSFTAWGLMKVKEAWVSKAWDTSRSASLFSKSPLMLATASGAGSCSEATNTSFWRQAFASKSSRRSKTGCRTPSKTTSGFPHQDSIVCRGTPAARSAFPKESSAMEAPSQFTRSAKASKGLAETCRPLSPKSGGEGSSKADHDSARLARKEPSSAVFGSEVPTTLLRKSCHERYFGSHSASR